DPLCPEVARTLAGRPGSGLASCKWSVRMTRTPQVRGGRTERTRSLMTEYNDITYEVENGLATITINRPERFNAFRAQTVDELIMAFKRSWASSEVGVIALTGAGDKAFCAGGDQKQRAETGDYGPSASGLFEVDS